MTGRVLGVAVVIALGCAAPAPPVVIGPGASNCGPPLDDDGSDAPSRARFAAELGKVLMELERVTGPRFASTAWNEGAPAWRRRVELETSAQGVADDLGELEAAIADRLPDTWRTERASWRASLPHATFRSASRALLELTNAAARPAIDAESKEQLRRIHTRLSLVLDTCL